MVQISLRIVQVDGKKRAQGVPLSDLQKGILGRVPSRGRLLPVSRVSLALPGGAPSSSPAATALPGEAKSRSLRVTANGERRRALISARYAGSDGLKRVSCSLGEQQPIR